MAASSFLINPLRHLFPGQAAPGSFKLSSLFVFSKSLRILCSVFWTKPKKPVSFLKCYIQNLMQLSLKDYFTYLTHDAPVYISQYVFAFFATGDLLLLTHRQCVIHCNPLYPSQQNYTLLFPCCAGTIDCSSPPCTHSIDFNIFFFPQIISPIHLGNFEF